MYDDLARTQNPTPLEWFVVNALIPSLIVTLVLQVTDARGARPATHAPNYTLIPDVVVRDQPVDVSSFPEGDLFPLNAHFACVERALVGDDDTPIILRWTRAGDPALLVSADVDGCVVLDAAVDEFGLVAPHSIVVVSATQGRLVAAARQTIIDHLRIITVRWQPLPLKVRVPVEFTAKE